MQAKVFDVHIHVQPWQYLKPAALELMKDAASNGVRELLEDPVRLLDYLDENGVERACCINYVSPDVMGFLSEVNDWIAKFTASHRDRLLPVGSVNVLHTSDVREETRRVLDLGIRMIKVHPPHQLYSPNAYRDAFPKLAELYEECQLRSIPVMFHTGTSVFPGARNVFADPMPIDDVAIDFPGLSIILAHCGRPLFGETAFFLARRHPLVHLELSGIPPKSILRFLPRIGEIADKVLWGTDWPSPGVSSMAKNVAAFRSLGLDPEAEQKILRGNAERLFGFE